VFTLRRPDQPIVDHRDPPTLAGERHVAGVMAALRASIAVDVQRLGVECAVRF
jgi:hypothetical protein